MPDCRGMEALEIDERESARFLEPNNGWEPARRLRPWHGALFAVTAGALVAATATAARRSAPASDLPETSSVGAITEEYAKNFDQCGGNGVNRKCQPGCFCWKKSDFFSMCKPIKGQSVCSAAAAKAAAKKAFAKFKPLAEKVDETKKAKEKAHKLFKEKLANSGETKEAAAMASSKKAATAEEATMSAVKEWHKDMCSDATDDVDKAKANMTKAKKKAQVEADKSIKEAEEKVKRAKENLVKVKKEAAKQVEKTIADEKKNVANREAYLKKTKATPLGPELEARKKKAEAAAKKAQETAVAAKKAAEEFIKAKKAMEDADKLAAKAVDNAKEAKEDYAFAKKALG